MNSDRRAFLSLLAALSCAPALAHARFVLPGQDSEKAYKTSNDVLISAFDDQAGQHLVGAYEVSQGKWLARVAVQHRYHSGVVRYTSEKKALSVAHIVFVARRPGKQAVVLDLASQQVIELQAGEGRHFYGHAAVDVQNRVWFTENDFANQRSLLVARSGARLETVDVEIDLAGIGPHEFQFLADGKTAVVGLGGIATHPDYPRKKLNLDTMQSEILLVDTQTQRIVHRDTPLDAQLSLRHLDTASDDTVVIGAQYQGPKYQQFPLVYKYQAAQGLVAFDAPESVWRSMNQYIASVQINSETREVMVSCPRANSVHLFSLDQSRWLSHFKLSDPGGVCLDQKGRYLVSTGQGKIVCLVSKNGALTLEHEELVSDTRWDNHMDRVVIS